MSLLEHISHKLSAEEMFTLFEELESFGALRRDVLIMKSLFMTGLRGEELTTLRWKGKALWQGSWYFDVQGKGSKNRRVCLPDPAAEGLEPLPALAGQARTRPYSTQPQEAPRAHPKPSPV